MVSVKEDVVWDGADAGLVEGGGDGADAGAGVGGAGACGLAAAGTSTGAV